MSTHLIARADGAQRDDRRLGRCLEDDCRIGHAGMVEVRHHPEEPHPKQRRIHLDSAARLLPQNTAGPLKG